VLGSGVVGHHNGKGERLSYAVAGSGPAGWVVLLSDYDHARTGSASTRLAASIEARSRPGMRWRFIAVFYRCLLPSSFGVALVPLSRTPKQPGCFERGGPAFGEG
jgi:hypothetical protein